MPKANGVSTKTQIEALEPKATNYPVPVVPKRGQGVRGLAVQVTPAGCKSFVLRFRFHGKQKTLTLGKFPAISVETALALAQAKWTEIGEGKNPSDTKRADRQARTVAEFAEDFIRDHIGVKVTRNGKSFKVELIRDGKGKPVGNKESTAREHIRLLDRNILPAIGKMAVKDVGTSDIASLLLKIRKKTPIQSNRVRSVLSKMFTEAEINGLRPSGSNPVKGQRRADENKKERNLSDLEILALGSALRATEVAEEKAPAKRQQGEAKPEDPYALAALRLALLTGMRKAEIIGDRYRGMPALTWDDVDLGAGVLRVHHKTETKTGKKRVVHLCSAARQLLEALPHQLGNPHVIPGEVAGHSLVNLQAVWDRLRGMATARAQKEAQESGQKAPAVDISDVTIHDLRRTFASVGARMGYPLPFLSALLGHAAGTVTEIYARVDGNPLKEAVETIGGRIAGLLSGEIDLTKEAEDAAAKEAKAQMQMGSGA
jgi:integrase